MYHLTLTYQERQAIECVGHRYWHGHEFFMLLWFDPVTITNVTPSDRHWVWNCDYTFNIPEHIAWQIRDGLQSEDSFCTCFDASLRHKLSQFIDSII